MERVVCPRCGMAAPPALLAWVPLVPALLKLVPGG